MRLSRKYPPGPMTSTVERVAVAVCRFVNERPGPKRAQRLYHRLFGDRIVRASVGRRVRVEGIERASELPPARAVLLCRSLCWFFDEYVLRWLLYTGPIGRRGVYAPVRSGYFSDRWSGLPVNGLIGGFVMDPPILR